MAEITKELLNQKLAQCGNDGFEQLIDGIWNQLKTAIYNRGASDMLKTLMADLDKPTETKG